MIDLKKIPKVELHVHLDGSLDVESVSKILNIDDLDAKKQMIAPSKCLDLNDYLNKFSLPVLAMQKYDDIVNLTYEFTKKLEEENVIYAEVRFAPLKHTDNLEPTEVVEAVLEGLKKSKITINLILCMMRNDSLEENKKVIDLAKQFLNKGVVAVDLAGAEGLYKTKNFEELFLLAKEYKIPFTIHSGEADGVESIESAIKFKTTRIGHGIRCIENVETLDKIKNNKILLEICPTSNIQTNVVDSLNNHPIKKLYDYGCMVSINTDNRTVSNVSLTDEYKNLIENCNLNIEDLFKINKMAINRAFISEEEKQKYINIIDNYLLNREEL